MTLWDAIRLWYWYKKQPNYATGLLWSYLWKAHFNSMGYDKVKSLVEQDDPNDELTPWVLRNYLLSDKGMFLH